MQIKALGIQGADNIDLVKWAVKGLGKEEAANALITTHLSDAQQKLILISKGLSEEEADELLALVKKTAAQEAATAATNEYIGANSRLKTVLKGVGDAILANPLTFIATAITAVVTITTIATTVTENYRKEIEETANAAAESNQTQTDHLTSIRKQYDDLTEKYEKLSGGVSSFNENVSLSNDEYTEYLDVCNEIAGIMPDLVQGYDDQGNAILSCKGNVEELTQAYRDMQRAANNAIITAADSVIKDFKNKVTDTGAGTTHGQSFDPRSFSDKFSSIRVLEDILNSKDIDTAINDLFVDQNGNSISHYPSARAQGVAPEIKELLLRNQDIINALHDAGLYQGGTESNEDYLRRVIKENRGIVQSVVSSWNKQVDDTTKNMKTLMSAYVDNQLLDIDDTELSSSMRTFIKSLASDLDYDFFNQFIEDGELNQEKLFEFVDDTISSIENLTGDQKNGIEIAFNAKAAFNGGKISIAEYQRRISNVEDIISGLPENVHSRIRLALDDSDFTKKVNKIKDGRSQNFNAWIDTLTEDEFDIVFDLVFNGGLNDLGSLQAQLKRIKEASDNLNEALQGMAGQFSAVTDAKTKYDEALKAGEKNDNFKSMAEAYQKLNDEVDAGTTNSNAFWAAAEYLFGSDKLESWGYSVEKIASEMGNLKDVFSDADTSGYGFLDKLYDMATNGQVIGKNGDLLAEIEKFSDGSWKFNVNAMNLDELASEMDMSKEAILSCLQALSMFGDVDFYDLTEVLDAVKQVGLSTDDFGGTVVNIDSLTKKLQDLGYSGKDIYGLTEQLRNMDGITLLDINSGAETLKQNLLDIGIAAENDGNIQINSDQLIGLMNTLSFTKDQAKGLFEELSKSRNVSFVDANGEAISLKDSLQHVDDVKFDGVTSEFGSVIQSAEEARTKTNDLQTAIDNLHGTTVTIDMLYNQRFTAGGFYGTSGKIPSHAKGTKGAPGGPSLTGEKGEELVQSGDRAYFVGTHGPQIVNLNPGDTVYTAEETRKIKSGLNGFRGTIPAYARGIGPKKFAIAIDGSSGKEITGAAIAKKLKGYTKKVEDSSSASSGSSGSSGGGSSSGSGSSSDKPQIYDWIKVAIERVETAVSRLKTTATSAFKAIQPKLSAAYEEIGKVNDELDIQEKGYARYMKEANSVGLDAGLAEKVRNGTIDINEYDSDTQSLITDYKKWYDAAEDCSDAIQKLHENLGSLYEENFNKVQDEYDNQVKLLSHLEKTYNSGLDLLEAKGLMASTSYYSALQDYEKQNIDILNHELSDLTTKFSEAMASGEIEEYSDVWYSMNDSINGVKESLADANVQLAEYAKQMRQVEWDRFDYVQDRISQITQESDFLIDLLSNSDLYTDKGQFNDKGQATLGLRAQNYNVYMDQANRYAKEILSLDQEIANDPYNTDLIQRREELLKLQQESITSAEDEKQAIVSLVKDGIDKELSSLKDLIDAYTDSLDSAKSLYDYQKKVTDKSSEIASLQKQLSAYANDTSDETRSKIQKLQVELTTAKQDLQETQYEQYITDQKKLLDNLYTDYEDILNQRLDNVDSLIGDMIDVVNENSGSISDTINQAASEVGYTLTDNLRNIWEGSFDGIVTKYGDSFDTQLTSANQVLNSIQANVAAMVAASDSTANASSSEVKTNATPIPTGPSTPAKSGTTQSPAPAPAAAKAIVVGGKINAGNAKIYSYPGGGSYGQYFDNDPIYTVLAESNGYLQVRHHKLSSGVTGWFKKSDVKAYKTGGLVDYTGIAQVDGTKAKPELMLNAADTENFLNLRDALRAMGSQDLQVNPLSGFNAPAFTGIHDISRRLSAVTGSNGSGHGDVKFGDIVIQIDHVENYNDFVEKLRNDQQFEKMIQSMTVDRVAGKSSFAKYGYKWK